MIKIPPIVGITSDYNESGDIFKGPAYFVGRNYVSAVKEGGGIPIILPYGPEKGFLEGLLERIDGLLVTGGNFDINPQFYGEMPIDSIGALNEQRTVFELEIARIAMKRDMPILGICGGEQLINVAGGGNLYQDIKNQVEGGAAHEQEMPKSEAHHSVMIEPDTKLHSILACGRIDVNSAHHQAVKELAEGFVVNAKAGDGVIEGIESVRHKFVIGVQWHPEFLCRTEKKFKRLFQAFVKNCEMNSFSPGREDRRRG